MKGFKYLSFCVFFLLSQLVQSQVLDRKPVLINKGPNVFPYPSESIHKKEEGITTVMLTINAEGKVISTEVINSSGYHV